MVNTEKLKEILNDEEYADSLLKLEDPSEIQKSLASKGVNLSIDEINQTKDFVSRYFNDELTETEKQAIDTHTNGDELSDDDLEAVTGGILPFIVLGTIVAACLTALGAGYVHEKTEGRW